MRTPSKLATLAAASAFATACAYENSSNLLVPSNIGTGAVNDTPVTTSYVGTWASAQSVGIPTPSSCGNFQWHVTSQTSASMTGDFSAVCAGNLTISGTASGQFIGNLVGNMVPISATGTASLAGMATCQFSLTGTGTISNGDTLTIPYTGTTCLGPVHGTETLRRHADSPPGPRSIGTTTRFAGRRRRAISLQ